MDWKYLLSLSPDNIQEDEKDHLYGTIAWFDTESEKLDVNKYNVLFRISQELMKYKSEQVEALLAELDEIAVRQGEEEARKQGSLDDIMSIKSKRSQIDYDDLEQKYKDFKSKYKQQLKAVDSLKTDNEKLKQSLKLAENENLHLQDEIKAIVNRGNESSSDISESVTDQYKELVQTIQQKNKHISQLLDDIQIVEKESLTLQDQVVLLKNELSDATNCITSMTNDYAILKIEINEKSDVIAQLSSEIETQRAQIEDYIEEKTQRDTQMDEFTVSIDKRVDEWKKILESKDEELERMRAETKQMSLQASKSSVSSSDDGTYVDMLTKVIHEREDQLAELKMQLQDATVEMEDNTLLFKQLSADKNAALKRVDELMSISKTLKSQLKTAHVRSQELQDGIEFAEKIAESKQADINEILNRLKNEGEIQLSEDLERTQKMKSQIRVQDKQIVEYVKMVNKLQNSLDHIVDENSALRSKLGISEEAEISTATVLLRQYKESKGHEKLKKKIYELEEEKMNLKAEVQHLQRKLSSVTLQRLNSTEKSVSTATEPVTSEFVVDGKTKEKEKDNPLLENEYLRKSLQEILEHLNAEQETAWTHPAMRLQAELDTMQDINKELKEQLQTARSELPKSDLDKGDCLEFPTNISLSTKDVITNSSKHLLNVLNSYHEQEEISSKLVEKLEKYKENFDTIEQQLKSLYKEHLEEKQTWNDKEKQYVNQIRELDQNVAVLNAKLIEFNSKDEDEFKKIERFAETSSNMVKLNRKCVFLENEEARLSTEVEKLTRFLAIAEQNVSEKIAKHNNEKMEMQSQIYNLTKSLELSVSSTALTNVQNRLEETLIKYREVLRETRALKSTYEGDVILLHETVQSLETQRVDLQERLLKATESMHICEAVSATEEVENMSKKLAQAEINEVTERQRANHMSHLYDLVKEQMQKVEERLQEQETVNQEEHRKNTVLQETTKALENKVMNYVAPDLYNVLKDKCVKLEAEKKDLAIDISRLKINLEMLQKSKSLIDEHPKENLEILSLKHQILDLQATSDDKALIARLSSDVVYARLAETEAQNKIKDLGNELLEFQKEYDAFKAIFEQENLEKSKVISTHEDTITNLKEIVKFQRELYMGSTPLISEEVLINNIQTLIKDKQNSFANFQRIQEKELCCTTLKEELDKRLSLVDILNQNESEIAKKIQLWHEERNAVLVKDLRLQKNLEFKSMQVHQLSERLQKQDEIIIKLEEELLRSYHTYERIGEVKEEDRKTKHSKALKQNETQTCSSSENKNLTDKLLTLETKLNQSEGEIKEKDDIVDQLKMKISELEKNVSLFRNQIADKQSQITFYEKHILDLQNKLTSQSEAHISNEQIAEQLKRNDEVVLLQGALKTLQDANAQKDRELYKYQSLIKRDRDEHSLAAARIQEDVRRLQEIIAAQEKAYKELQETSLYHPGKVAIEQYINQVHALENHTADLHTTVSTLNSQLQSSRQEAIRWQALANERLDNVDQLRAELEEQHNNELLIYKKDSQKWREEICKLKELINKHRQEMHKVEPDLKQILVQKDEEIRELNVIVKKLQTKHSDKGHTISTSKSEGDDRQQPVKDYETLKKKYELTLNRERQAKEDLRNLKEQIAKRPAAAKADRNEKEEKYQRRISHLLKEIEDLKDKLEKQAVISEAHKVAVNEDYEKWKKLKFWQQSLEKLKVKHQNKCDDYEKLNQTCAGYKILIERLEREKRAFESKIRNIRNTEPDSFFKRIDALHAENDRLAMENEELNEKLQMHQHHSGALGAAMLEEKLEAQEKKIAILELTSKGNVEVRAEFERLQAVVESQQKLNLRLEAENLDLKLDLEKYANDTPRLCEQIQHLESYIEVLKTENAEKHIAEHEDAQPFKSDGKKIADLERTVFVLKRVVEKLQVDNKRLTAARPCQSGRVGHDKLRVEHKKLKEQYGDRLQEIMRLEEQLKASRNKIKQLEERELSQEVNSLAVELSRVKAELDHKTELLDKIKVLLHRAASKEKSLLQENDLNNLNSTIRDWLRQKIAALREIVPQDFAPVSSRF